MMTNHVTDYQSSSWLDRRPLLELAATPSAERCGWFWRARPSKPG